MSSRSIYRQWNAFLQPMEGGKRSSTSNKKWVTFLSSASVAVAVLFKQQDNLDKESGHDNNADDKHHNAISTLLHTRQRRQTTAAKCETVAPYQRVNQTPNNGSEFVLSPRRSLLNQRSKQRQVGDMYEKYEIDHKTILGEGAYGRVYQAHMIKTGETVALKKISKQYTNSTSFNSETDALLRIHENGNHPNISGLRDFYEDYGHYYLILDLARGGEMFDHLIQHGQYSELDASRLVSEILSALAFLHNIGVIHSDLKPENLLLCSPKKGAETIKVIDFGCASVEKRGDETLFSERSDGTRISNKSNSYTPQSVEVGTRAYWSPERFTKNAPITEAVDMYALGVILFIMLVGVHPFDITGIATDDEIERGLENSSPPMHLAAHLSPSARDFIKSLMERDPNKRSTAIQALQHPWIRGVTPTSDVIEGSDTKLSMYQDLRDKLASGIFAALVVDEDHLRDTSKGDRSKQQSLTHLLKRAFEVFDAEGKGYVNENDLARVMSKVTGSSMSRSDRKNMIKASKNSSSVGLSLSDFAQLFSRISHEHYNRGDYIYCTGDEGDKMFFINSGKVDIFNKSGHLVSTLSHGEFFGEGSLFENRNYRVTSVRCSTPVDLIAVSKEDFKRYASSSDVVLKSLKLKHKARALEQAKQLIRLQTNLTKRQLHKGDIVFREGDVGKSMFLVDDGSLEAIHNGKTLHKLTNGDSFGESSLLFTRPRSSTVLCTSGTCSLYEMKGSDFLLLLQSDPTHANALRDMCRQKMLQKAVKSSRFGHSIKKAFEDADRDGTGTLSSSEMRDLMLHLGKNSAIPESEIEALIKSLDQDEDGQVSLSDLIDSLKLFDSDDDLLNTDTEETTLEPEFLLP